MIETGACYQGVVSLCDAVSDQVGTQLLQPGDIEHVVRVEEQDVVVLVDLDEAD